MAEVVGSLEQLTAALTNPNFTSYVYIGTEQDRGWKLAIAAQKMLPALRVYCVTNPAVAAQVRTNFNAQPPYVGIVFGWGSEVKDRLLPAQADDYLTLTQAIANAS